MSDTYVIYNGVSSETMGVVMEALPDFHRPARRVQQNQVYGRPGLVITDEGGYDAFQTQMKINAFGADLRSIYGWLRGEGWMVSSDEPGYMAYVYLYGQIDDLRLRAGGTYDTLTVPMLVEPYLREVNEAAIDFSAPGTFEGRGHDPAQPLLRVTGSGSVNLMVNGATVLIDGLNGEIIIDSEAGVAYRETDGGRVWAGTMVTLLDGWPELVPGGQTNRINWSGDIRRVLIQPKWRWL